jgi:hypothetical protein
MPAITLLPLSVTLVGAVFAFVLFSRYFGGKKRPHELVWGISFSLFAIAAASEAYAEVSGHWNEMSARIYYLFGAILVVGLLGIGTAYLLFSRKIADRALIGMIVFAVVAGYLVFTARVDAKTLGEVNGWRAVVVNDSGPRVMAGLSNSLGTIVVAGGALWSALVFWRKRIMKERMFGVMLIALGTVVTAIGGSILALTGLTNPEYHNIGILVGVVIMFFGFLQSIRVPHARALGTERVVERAA